MYILSEINLEIGSPLKLAQLNVNDKYPKYLTLSFLYSIYNFVFIIDHKVHLRIQCNKPFLLAFCF